MRENLTRKRQRPSVLQRAPWPGFVSRGSHPVAALYKAFGDVLVKWAQRSLARDVKEIMDRDVETSDLDVRTIGRRIENDGSGDVAGLDPDGQQVPGQG